MERIDNLEALRARLAAFAAERDWDQFHNPKNLAMALAAEAGELLEHFQWLTFEQSDKLRRRRAPRWSWRSRTCCSSWCASPTGWHRSAQGRGEEAELNAKNTRWKRRGKGDEIHRCNTAPDP